MKKDNKISRCSISLDTFLQTQKHLRLRQGYAAQAGRIQEIQFVFSFNKSFITVRRACPPELAEPEGPDKRRLGVDFE
jgi:hypothetical protein